jgi:hypothetical protein
VSSSGNSDSDNPDKEVTESKVPSSSVAVPTTASPKSAHKGVAGKLDRAVSFWEVSFYLAIAASNFYFETFSVYACISALSPIPYAICDVVRRLTMIVFSVLYFQVQSGYFRSDYWSDLKFPFLLYVT